MNDKTILENYLLILKSTVEVYVHGTLESSNNTIRDTLKECLNRTLSHQADTYDLMVKNGWYQTNNVASKEIENTLSKLENDN